MEEARSLDEWRRARLLAYFSMQGGFGGKKGLKPEHLFPLPGDKPASKQRQRTAEEQREWEEKKRRWDRIMMERYGPKG